MEEVYQNQKKLEAESKQLQAHAGNQYLQYQGNLLTKSEISMADNFQLETP